MPRVKRIRSSKGGQSLIESCLAVVLVCLVFAGVLQISQLFAAKEVLNHAAARAARARAVGFNYWMVYKSGLVAAIPNAGRMTEPAYTNVDLVLRAKVETSSPGELWDWALGEATPSSRQYAIERARIPEFLEAANDDTMYNVLNYSEWDGVDVSAVVLGGSAGALIQGAVRQNYPLRIPMHRSFYDADSMLLTGESFVENHYSLYLDDYSW